MEIATYAGLIVQIVMYLQMSIDWQDHIFSKVGFLLS